MTSKISLFNRGIYKSTVRRYIWGSVFYAIVLFMCTVLPILFSENPDSTRYMLSETPRSIILDDIYLYFPLVFSIFVPTVTALLVYRFVHSKKTSVFVHSLPVTRLANYKTSVLAALTLMSAPIVLNGAILCLMSLGEYGALFDVTSCLVWTGLNLLAVFLMFSVASVAAFLTGNSFAMVGINVLIHLVAIIFAGSFSSLSEAFLYGYYDMNLMINATVEWNFVGYIMSAANNLRHFPVEFGFSVLKLFAMIGLALALYIAAYLLYRKRRLETCEDVAAYRILNPIYKYLLTFIVSLGSFGIFSYMFGEAPMFPVLLTLILSAVSYFAAEMVLKKSFKIWGAYKGYLIFLALFAALICTFVFTSFFGFETRVPDIGDVQAVEMHRTYYSNDDRPYVEDEALFEFVLETHRELVRDENIRVFNTTTPERSETLFVGYKLNNGRTLTRRFNVSEEMLCETLDTLYESENYKTKTLEIFSPKIGEIKRIELPSDGYIKGDDIPGFMEALTRDLMSLKFTECSVGDSWERSVYIEYIPNDIHNTSGTSMLSQRINANFKNTIKWLSEHDLMDGLFNSANENLTILTHEQWQAFADDEKELLDAASYGKEMVTVQEVRTFENIPDAVLITDAAAKAKIRDFVLSTPVRYVPGREYSYYVCTVSENERYVNITAAFYEDADELMEFVR